SDNMVRKESIETASTVTSIIPASTVIGTQNNQPEPISSELINLDRGNTLQRAKKLANRASYNPCRSSQTGIRCDYGRSQPGTEGKGAHTATRGLSGHIKSQPQSIEQCPAVQGVPDPCRSVEKLHEFLPDCQKIPGPCQYFPIAQWMASSDGEEKHNTLDTTMEKKHPSTTQASAKNSSSGQQKQFQCEKAATRSKQGQRKGTSHQTLQSRLQDSKNPTACNGKCVSDGPNNDGITKERGGQIKISETISNIF
ncbi:hypothetical protein O181_123250, partial [Austropuccinia psidii MF-1]|nr:hypothetical protein [Austropuccinia psidii MF-1]